MENQNKIKYKKNNARLYSIYMMISFNLVFYYTISFLFFTTVKNFSVAEVLLIGSFLPLFKVLIQIPTTLLIQKIGKKKVLVIGNFLIILYLVQLITCNNLTSLIFATAILATAVSFKELTTNNILYESLNHKQGKGIYSKIESIGTYYYYIFDAITAVISGFLFVKNGYYPLYFSIVFAILSFCISMFFKENKKIKNTKVNVFKDIEKNLKDIISPIKFIVNSNRLKALFFFGAVFYTYKYIFLTARNAMIVDIVINPISFSIIVAVLQLIGGISIKYIETYKKIFKNKILISFAFISMSSGLIATCIFLLSIDNSIKIKLMFILFIFQYITNLSYIVLMEKYLKSFSGSEMAVKIKMVYNIIIYLAQAIFTFIASYILGYFNIGIAVLLIGIVYFILLIFVAKYMKNKVGLKPNEYKIGEIEKLN